MKRLAAFSIVATGLVFVQITRAGDSPRNSAHSGIHTVAEHKHGPTCGHKAVAHDKHTDWIHDGVYHCEHNDHYDSHGAVIAADGEGQRSVASDLHVQVDEKGHKHGENCGHKTVKHDDHIDYIHDGHYHALHGAHGDDHGAAVKN
jgi:hypothetical protein